MRVSYEGHGIDPADVPADPGVLFRTWLADAESAGVPEPNAMVVATIGSGGEPHARTVLLKGLPVSADGATALVFYTNLQSGKAGDLEATPDAAVVFPWHAMARQVRVECRAQQAPAEMSDGYFASRPRESQLGAWASEQSRPVADRRALDRQYDEIVTRFEGQNVPRPPFWGGFLLEPFGWEFWVGHRGRLHDRVRYDRDSAGWRRTRLQP